MLREPHRCFGQGLLERGSFSNCSPLLFFFFYWFCFVFQLAFLFLLFTLTWELCSDRPSLVKGFSFNKLPFCDTRQMSTLENSQPPRICTLEHISLPNPQFAVDQAIRGCSSLDTRASPLQGSMTWCYGEVNCVGEGCSQFGGETQTWFKAGEGAIQQF